MASDLYTKLVFTLIALCLVLITAQGFGLGPRPAAPPPGSQPFQIVWLPGAGMLVRVDQRTGETSTMNVRGGLSGWRTIQEEPRPEGE